jgi:hypothetical protein
MAFGCSGPGAGVQCAGGKVMESCLQQGRLGSGSEFSQSSVMVTDTRERFAAAAQVR